MSESGGMTLQDSIEQLKHDGIWSDEEDGRMEQLEKDINKLKSKLSDFEFQKKKQRAIKDAIRQGEKELDKLRSRKYQLYPHTIDYLAEYNKQHYLIKQILDFDREDLLTNENFLKNLINKYFIEDSVEEKSLREIARSDPWRLHWTLAKDTGTPLFDSSSYNVTDLQYQLIFWSKIYDFAFENMNRPPDDVINDDDKFDSWYESETKRIDKEVKDNFKNESFGKTKREPQTDSGVGITEKFIPADKEGAQEVYDLNSVDARRKVKSRQKAIQEKGYVKEQDLPDTSREIQMKLNQLAAQHGSQ